jgi:hypothetical protein
MTNRRCEGQGRHTYIYRERDRERERERELIQTYICHPLDVL